MNALQKDSSASIEHWLKGIPTVSTSSKAQAEGHYTVGPPFDITMVTPPPSLTSNRKPDNTWRKRARIDNDDIGHEANEQNISGEEGCDHDKTPSASSRNAPSDFSRPGPPLSLPARPLFRQTPSLSSSATSQASSTRSRSSSPVKRSMLSLLRKPLCFVTLEDDPTQQLPTDILPTYDRVVEIAVHREAFLPAHIEPEIRRTHRAGMVKDRWFYQQDVHHHEADHSPVCSNCHQHSAELSSLRDIEKAANMCQTEEASEAAWNLEVHGPLLKLALVPFPFLRRDLLTTARISKPYIPEMHAASAYDCTRAKMVDWGVRVCQPAVVAAAIRSKLDALPEAQRCLNQTTYGPVRYDPIAIFIETKTAGGTTEEARVQLGIWVAAWHRRMAELMETCSLRSELVDRIITVPLIVIMEHEWRLSFACDKGDKIDIVGDMAIGDTRTLLGLYTILAVLRTLAAWAEKNLTEWLQRAIL